MLQRLLLAVFLGGGVVAYWLFGGLGVGGYILGLSILLAEFRRPLVLALTHLAVRTGSDKETLARMPAAIHLVPNTAVAEASSPLVEALRGCEGVVDLGAWTITELPRIALSLLVDPARGILIAVEAAKPVGAYANVHALYADGRIVSFTNSPMPAPRHQRSNVTRHGLTRAASPELLARARALPAGEAMRELSSENAPRVYEELYAADIAARRMAPLPTATARSA